MSCLGEVEASRGSGGAAQPFGVHCLIPFRVLQGLMDIRRQGRLADLLYQRLIVEFHQAQTILHRFNYPRFQFVVKEDVAFRAANADSGRARHCH